VDLPALGRHPQAAKLRLTNDLPRRPGVYMFRSGDGEVLYVGKATDLRSRVRSYFGSDDRRKIGPLLTELQRIVHVECPTPFEAAVLEVRLIQKLLPRYNRVGTKWSNYCYVRLPSRAGGKFVVTPVALGTAPHLGPFPSRGMARLAVTALEEAMRGRREDPAELALVRPAELLAPLHTRMRALAAMEAFEQAAALRDRAGALSRALGRQHRCGALAATGQLDVRVGGHHYSFHCGRLRLEHLATAAVGIGRPREPKAVSTYPDALPVLDRDVIDELMLASTFLDRAGRRARIDTCTQTPMSLPIRPLPHFEPCRPPGLAQPGLTQPGLTQPGLAQPGLAQPGLTRPDLRQPDPTSLR
jgi:DNA polymerase III subunit epsilon